MKESKAKILFKDWAYTWLEEKKGTVKGNTYKTSYEDVTEHYLLPDYGEKAICDISRSELTEHLKKLGNSYSLSTLKKVRICASGIFNTAINEGACDENIAKGIKLKSRKEKKVRMPYTAEQRELIFSYAATHKYGLGVCILLDTGLRCSEMLGLKWEDIDYSNGFLTVYRASVAVYHKAYIDSPKSEESKRTIPLPTRLTELLRKSRKGRTGFIFLTQSGKPFTPCGYTKQRYDIFFKEAVEVLHVPRLSHHMLRHTCGTLLYANSGDIYAVSRYMGHSSVEVTTKFYVHSSPALLKQRLGIQ